MLHSILRSDRIRATSPKPSRRPQKHRFHYPVSSMPLLDELHPRHKGDRSFQASFLGTRQAQVMAKTPPPRHLVLEERTCHTTSLAEPSPSELALEGRTSQKTPLKHLSAGLSQLDLAQLEHKMLELDALKEEVRKLVAKLPPASTTELAEVDCQQSSDNNNNNNTNNNNTDNNNNNTTTNNNTNNNNEPNNYNDNSKTSQESSFNNADLDKDNPESEPDLDSTSFSFLIPTLGAESRQDQQEDSFSFRNLGHQKMAKGHSSGSLIHKKLETMRGCKTRSLRKE